VQEILDQETWLRSRDIPEKEADRILSQLENQFIYIRRSMRGEIVPSILLERELIELVIMTRRGQFPVSQQTHARNCTQK
jgi:hypothetical protein